MKRYFWMILAIGLLAIGNGRLAIGNEKWDLDDEQSSKEAHWKTHFAYNSVQQIAVDHQEVYAVANGKLFSINQISEKVRLYNNFSGMHGTDIAQIAYDTTRCQMLMIYTDGKIDVWKNTNKMQYVSDLYSKQLNYSKGCNNISIEGKMAYLSMDFGILSFDLEEYKIVDTYYIGYEAEDRKVLDVLVHGDSIYAQTKDSIYAAHRSDNIVDYRYWHASKRKDVAFDTKKGKEYICKNGDIWRVAGVKGVERVQKAGGKSYYLPEGPQVNVAYKLVCQSGRLYMVQGGRWVNQNKQDGHIMVYDGDKWLNITSNDIQTVTGKPALDMTDIAVDKADSSHFFVTSYGTGLYEFKDDKLVQHYTPNNSIIGAAAPNNPDRYTRTDAAVWDDDGNVWVTVAGGVDTSLVCFRRDGSQRGLNLYQEDGEKIILSTPGGILVDGDRKWVISCRSDAAVIVLEDGGTKWDMRDDNCKLRKDYLDQDGGVVAPEFFYTVAKSPDGEIWIGSSSGPIIIEQNADVMNSNRCKRLRIRMADDSYLLETERVNCFAWDSKGQVWIGTQTGGVYVLNKECTEIVSCWTNDNSVMPANCVLTMAYDEDNGKMYIGTSGGLVAYIEEPDVVSSNKWQEEVLEDNMVGMYRWRAHPAFSKIDEVVGLGNLVYGLSSQSLFSVDKTTGVVRSHTKLDGLSASSINHIALNKQLDKMLVTYENGMIDIVDQDGNIETIVDLYLKQMTASKAVQDVCIYKEKAYLAMNWGILVLNMQKVEIEDTYYIGYGSSEVDVKYICTVGEKVYAMTDGGLYCANMQDNLVDYAYWSNVEIPSGNAVSGMREFCGMLFMVIDGQLWKLQKDSWIQIPVRKLRGLHETNENLWLLPVKSNGIGKLPKVGALEWFVEDMVCHSIVEDGNQYWIGTENNGLVKYHTTSQAREQYSPEGPSSNYAYKVKFFGDRLYMLPGGRWADRYKRAGEVMIYKDDIWHNLRNADLRKQNQNKQVLDLMNITEDQKDETHYFVTSYGTGLYEMRNNQIINTYLPSNSKLMSAVEEAPLTFTRTDGIVYDSEGNLWIINAGGGETKNIHVITPDKRWYAYQVNYGGKAIEMHTPGDILIDRRKENWKWIPLLRYNTGLILLDDNGTPTNSGDDKVMYRTEWVDQNNNILRPITIHTVAQDHNNALWIGTDDGILVIPANVDFANSNRCWRVIIPRNDGTMLGDWLLDNEQINDIKIDGGNRLWVATANSGVFLLKPTMDDVTDPSYSVETVKHFTTENSILPSNNILSIAIQESSGEVYMGTSAGLVSYMSDASEARADYKEISVYPNPVRENYSGYITFNGLVKDSELRIVDASGCLVKILESNGGRATWDGKNTQGKRVASGVYTALCNTKNGEIHGTVKVLVIN
jgi:ligand-binding sensor domain-containing protein